MGLQILELKSPEEPKIIKTVSTPGTAFAVAVKGDYAYVADGEQGLQVVDIEPLDMCYIVRNVPTTTPALNVQISGNEAYIGCQMGFVIADISAPERALQINENSVDESFGEFTIRGDWAYYAHSGGLYIVYVKKPKWAYVKGRISPEGEGSGLVDSFTSVSYG
jgi:hypothetical protein